MDLSYQERSALASLAAVLIVFGVYFSTVFGLLSEDQLNAIPALAVMIVAVIALVIIEIVFQIAVTIPAGAPDADERDKLISAKAARNSGVALGAGVLTTIIAILVSEIRGGIGDAMFRLTPVVIAQILVLLIVVAQIFEYLSQLYFYRRGV